MFQFRKNVIFRFKLVAISLFTVWAMLIIVKGAIVMFKEKEYWSIVKDTRFIRRNVEIKPQRGNILSDNGELLASSLPKYQLYIDFMCMIPGTKMIDKKAQVIRDSIWDTNMNEICKGLSRIFPDWSSTQFRNHLKKGRKMNSQYYRLYPRRVSYSQFKEVKQLPVLNRRRYESGLCEVENIQREKPFGSLAKSTLGEMYAQKDSAYSGLEQKYDSILRGKSGKSHREKVGKQYLDMIEIPAENGYDVLTTLNVEMQDICEKALIEELKQRNSVQGLVVLLEVETGDIKAIVNLGKNEQGNYEEKDNYALNDLREPGSIFKTIALAAAIEEDRISIDDSVRHYNGSHIFYGRKDIKDTTRPKNGGSKYSITEVLKFSSNVGMGEIINNGFKKSPQDFTDRIIKMGLLEHHKLLIGEGRSRIKTPKDKSWSMSDLISLSYGYASMVNAMNMVNFYNTIANSGNVMRPRLVRAIAKEGITVKEFDTETIKRGAISSNTIQDLQKMLLAVVNSPDGTGKRAGSDKFLVAGKTGTARISKNGGYDYSPIEYLLSFCGYFPADEPKYSCIVQIINKGGPASGGLTSGVVFGQIAERIMAKSLYLPFEQAKDTVKSLLPTIKHGNLSSAKYILDKLDIDFSGRINDNEDNPTWGRVNRDDDIIKFEKAEINEQIVPNVVGMGAKDAVFLMKKVGLNVGIIGRGRVTEQSLQPGRKAGKGAYISLTLRP